MEMVTVPGSYDNIHELLEILDVMKSPKFEEFPNAWREQITRSADYHTDWIGPGGDFLYYDPWLCRKIDAQRTKSRAAVTRVVPDHVPMVWFHV